MKTGDLCSKTVRTISATDPMREAATRMRDHDVGTLVVIEGMGPVEGIVTDRDLVTRGMAAGRDPDSTTVGDIMTRGPAAVERSLPMERALHVMADQEVRRLVVLNEEGFLCGVLSLDDVVSALVDEVGDVNRLIRRQAPV